MARSGREDALGSALGNLADLIEAFLVGGEPGVACSTPARVDAAPDLAERPDSEQVPGDVDRVVAARVVVDPGVVLFHASKPN